MTGRKAVFFGAIGFGTACGTLLLFDVGVPHMLMGSGLICLALILVSRRTGCR